MKTYQKVLLGGMAVFAFLTVACQPKTADANRNERREKTAFQTCHPWRPTIDVRADVAIVYGVGGNPFEKAQDITFEQRIDS